MDTDVLVAYASKHGSTREVAERIAGTLAAEGLDVELEPAGDVRTLDGCRAVVLGSALYMGRPCQEARAFVRRHRQALAEIPFAAFALGPGDLEPEHWQSSREQLVRGLRGLEPRALEVFGGVVDPDRLSFPFNRMPAVDLRDWEAIERFARTLPATLGVATRSAGTARSTGSREARTGAAA